MAVDGPVVYRVNPILDLHWRDWDQDSVVLEGTSGQMFQFDALSAALMACFESGPCDVSTVVAHLASDLGIAPDDEFIETVDAVVEEFRKLGWLEPIIAG